MRCNASWEHLPVGGSGTPRRVSTFALPLCDIGRIDSDARGLRRADRPEFVARDYDSCTKSSIGAYVGPGGVGTDVTQLYRHPSRANHEWTATV
jgi:hypothetical protein